MIDPLTGVGFATAALTAIVAWWRDRSRQEDTKLDLASTIALNLAGRLEGEALTYKTELDGLRQEFEAHRSKQKSELEGIYARMRKCEEDRALLLEMAREAGKDTSRFQ